MSAAESAWLLDWEYSPTGERFIAFHRTADAPSSWLFKSLVPLMMSWITGSMSGAAAARARAHDAWHQH